MDHINEREGITAKTTRTATSKMDGTFEFGGLGTGAREIVVAIENSGTTTFVADPSETANEVIVIR